MLGGNTHVCANVPEVPGSVQCQVCRCRKPDSLHRAGPASQEILKELPPPVMLCQTRYPSWASNPMGSVDWADLPIIWKLLTSK